MVASFQGQMTKFVFGLHTVTPFPSSERVPSHFGYSFVAFQNKIKNVIPRTCF